MMQYTTEQLVTTIALPSVTILLIWTVVIFHKNRKKWGPYDIPIVCILILSIIRNSSILGYLMINSLTDPSKFSLEYCSVVVWMFSSVHTFQASSLTTIAIIGLFSVKLYSKKQHLKQFLTPTHMIYHLFCLTTLCACVGVAGVLAQNVNNRDSVFRLLPQTAFECKFMPFNLDIKFNIFILVLHMFLSVISFTSFILMCCRYYKVKDSHFDYIKKSNSDLSDFSLENNIDDVNKNYYDTYTLQRAQNDSFFQNDFCGNRDLNWNSDLSNMSTTVSSVNSKRPCLDRCLRERQDLQENRTGLETIHPVLIVCYLFYHLPIIVLCIYPDLIFPWSVTGIALWLGLIQDVLVPVGLGIVDSRFCKWVSSVYSCTGSSVEEKLPHVGLVGKFRPYNLGSQPQSLEVQNTERNLPVFQAVEHRFPITNGSLYTSIDGRLPVIHNYRRNNKDNRRCTKLEKHQANVAFHSALLSHRHEYMDNTAKFPSCSNCETDLCPSHSNLHHLSTGYINKQLNQLNNLNGHLNLNQFKPGQLSGGQLKPGQLSGGQFKPGQLNGSQFKPGQNNGSQFKPGQNNRSQFKHAGLGRTKLNAGQLNSVNLLQLSLLNQKAAGDRISHSEESLHTVPDADHDSFYEKANAGTNSQAVKNSRNLLRLHRMRLSRSEDSLNDLQVKEMGKILQLNIHTDARRSSTPSQTATTPQIKSEDTRQDIYSSDEEYTTDINENFDSMSSKSCYSITTEANCDFDFFQSNNNHQKVRNDGKEDENLDDQGYYIINDVNNKPVMTCVKPINEKDSPMDDVKNFRITRSNSKRSLENFQAFIEVEENLKNNNKYTLQRSSSYMTLEDRRKSFNSDKYFRNSCKESDYPQFHVYRQKVKSEEFLPNTTTVYIEDSSGCFEKTCNDNCDDKCMHDVPDLKKVFISEYI